MGIDLTCSSKTFSCGYSFWNELRTATIVATAEYLKYQLTITQYENGTYDFVAQQIINEFMKQLLSYGSLEQEQILEEEKEEVPEQDITEPLVEFEPTPLEDQEDVPLISLFLGNCTLDIIDILIFFGLGGLYSFCNKSDCEGYYSVGNAYDICEFLKLIKPFLIKNKKNMHSPDNNFYKFVTEIEKVFKESVETKNLVVIC
jgi:hypothetical protein